MSGWTNPDVTPVGGDPGSRADDAPVAGLAPGDDPFGSRPSAPRRGWVRIVAGALLVVAGVVATAAGIVEAVGQSARIEDDAVARGTVRAGSDVDAVQFMVPAGERRDYSVYLLFGGVESNSTIQELAVRDTGCVATMPDGVQTAFRGARQGTSATIGKAASVGHFSSQPGAVQVRCTYTSGTRRSERRRPEAVPYVVTPGKPSAVMAAALPIVGGVFGAIGGGFLAAWGWRRRRAR